MHKFWSQKSFGATIIFSAAWKISSLGALAAWSLNYAPKRVKPGIPVLLLVSCCDQAPLSLTPPQESHEEYS